MTLSDWYDQLKAQLISDGFKVIFSQPQVSDPLPLVQFGPHTDLDVSSHSGTLNEVDQQINLWCEVATSPAEFEELIRKIKWSLSRAGRWDNLTTQTMIDDSAGRDIRRALFILTVTI